ncbi:hypothetical protein PTKIN_Ptkin07bG0289200 [Pterospermum kingtungense]
MKLVPCRIMADSENNDQDIADFESNYQEMVEDDLCLVADTEYLEWDTDNSFYELPIYSRNSRASRTLEDYARPPRHSSLKNEVRLVEVVMDHALHLLPAKSLCRFRTVSKGWDQWLSSPLFAHRQTTHFKDISGLFCQVSGFDLSFISLDRKAYGIPDPSLKFLPEPVNIRSSCNGLLCCQSVGDNAYYICNPVTKEWKMLPKSILYHGPEAAIVLVFEPQALDFNESYELVCAVTFPDDPFVKFEIYSSRSSSWRVSETMCFELGGMELHNGYYMKGAVYWESSSGVILAFDLRYEQYGILPLPLSDGLLNGALTMMHGELCYILPRSQDNTCTVYVHGNMDMRLKSVINLPRDNVGGTFDVCRALPSINDDILMLALGTKVIAYHVREQKVELIYTLAFGAWARFFPYVNSLAIVRHPLVGDRA